MSDQEPNREIAPGMNQAEFWHYYQRYPYLLAKAALWAGGIYIVYWLVKNVEAVVFPVAVSFLIAYLLDPAVDWLEEKCDRVPYLGERGFSRELAIGAFLLVILAALVGFTLILYPALAKQITKLVERAPELIGLIQERLIPWVQTHGVEVPPDLTTAFAAYADTVKGALPDIARKVTQWTGGLIAQTGAVVASLLNLVMIPIFTFYFLRDFDAMTSRMAEFVPRARHDWYQRRIELADDVVGEWFRGQVTVALILAALYALGFGITFWVAGIGGWTGAAIGVLAGVLNIIPYFGVLIGSILAILMVLLDWTGWAPVLAIGAVIIVIQLLEGYWVTPKVVGEKVGLSPVTVIIVLLLGGELFGLLGVLLALPVAGIIRVLLPDIIGTYKKTPFYSGNYRPEFVHIPDPSSDELALAEHADGTVDHEDEAEPDEGSPSAEKLAALKRPVKQSDARASDRGEVSAAMDGGTDGSPDDDEEEDGDAPDLDRSSASDPDEDEPSDDQAR